MSEIHQTAAVITVSDSAYDGNREDASGPAVAAALTDAGFHVVALTVVPDDATLIADALREFVAHDTPFIVTTGGTGLGPRDITPEATRTVIAREVPGLAEEMRRAGLRDTRYAMLSRGMAGVCGASLIVNLPGSPQGAVSSLTSILDVLPHALAVLRTASFPHDTRN